MESNVKKRYAAAANAPEPALCCPVEYDQRYLEIIPQEVIEKDYGCGDPSRYLQPGETVLDLGSGTGKICFIASQVVGPEGNVIGIDMTDDMLEVAQRNAPIVAERAGHANVVFKKGRIQDLALDLDLLDDELVKHPVLNANDFLNLDTITENLKKNRPLVSDASIDAVVSNCVLNLVHASAKNQMFSEIFRVIKRGGRAIISDIVSDEIIPQHLQDDHELWSGCISGALTEEGFLKAFEEAGFYGIEILKRDESPWQTVEGIEFRGITVQAFKGKEGVCLERNQAVVYRGPFKAVTDDDGHTMERGKRYATCDKNYQIYGKPPYEGHFERIEPNETIPLESAKPFGCVESKLRHPKETKGAHYKATIEVAENDACC